MTRFPVQLTPHWQKIWDDSRRGKGMLTLTWDSIEPFVRTLHRASRTGQGATRAQAIRILYALLNYYRLQDRPSFLRKLIDTIRPHVVSYSIFACQINDIHLLQYWLGKNELGEFYVSGCYMKAIEHKNLDMVKALTKYLRRILGLVAGDIIQDNDIVRDLYTHAILSRDIPIIRYLCNPRIPFRIGMPSLIEAFADIDAPGQPPAQTRISDTIREMVLKKYVKDNGIDQTIENIENAHRNDIINGRTGEEMNDLATRLFRNSPARKIQTAWRKREVVKSHRKKTTMKRLRGRTGVFAR